MRCSACDLVPAADCLGQFALSRCAQVRHAMAPSDVGGEATGNCAANREGIRERWKGLSTTTTGLSPVLWRCRPNTTLAEGID